MTDQVPANPAVANAPTKAPGAMSRMSEAVPPHAWFGVSAVFHYLGPAFAVLLFPVVGVLGVAWFRIASAALVFALVTKPWRTFQKLDQSGAGLAARPRELSRRDEQRILLGARPAADLTGCCH